MRTHSCSSRLQGCSKWAWLVLLLPAHPVFAQPQDSPTAVGLGTDAQPAWMERDLPERVANKKSWYGWQTLTTDGLALTGFAVAGALSESPDSSIYNIIALGSLSSYMLGAPIIHAAHGNWGAAAGSLGLRSLPLGSSFAAYAACGGLFQQNESCAATFTAIMAVTFVLPIALDPFFAYEDPPKHREHDVQVSAWFERSGGGVTVGDIF